MVLLVKQSKDLGAIMNLRQCTCHKFIHKMCVTFKSAIITILTIKRALLLSMQSFQVTNNTVLLCSNKAIMAKITHFSLL